MHLVLSRLLDLPFLIIFPLNGLFRKIPFRDTHVGSHRIFWPLSWLIIAIRTLNPDFLFLTEPG